VTETYNGKLDQSEIQSLLKNIGEVLQHYSVKEFNAYLVTAINKKSDNHYAEEYILSLVCETYKITRRNLIFSKSNYAATTPRQVAYCLLHYTLGLSPRYIAKRIFHLTYHSTVSDAVSNYKKLDPNIKPDKEMIDSISMLKEKVLEKIKTKENK
jgi:chromosomal replication initiation ATPase DnaA